MVFGVDAVPLPPLGEHELLVFWVQVVVLLFAARLGGYLVRAIGQPRVVGELLAGVALGPSIAGELWPSGWSWLFPDDARQSGLLLGPAWIGIVLLLMLTGAESDLGAVRREGRAAASTAVGSLVLPAVSGVALGLVLPDEFVGAASGRGVFAVFVGVALAISSLPVAARILSDLGMLDRPVGRLVLAVAMSNDVVGWLVLGVLVGVAEDDVVAVGSLLGSAAGMLAIIVIVPLLGPPALDAVFGAVARREGGPAAWVSLAFLFTVAVGALTHALGLEVVIGAFIAGIAIGRSRLGTEPVMEHVEVVASAIFIPLFFAVAGLRVDLTELADPTVLSWTIVVCVVAAAAKLVGSYAGARLGGIDGPTSAIAASALNARGALEIVVATVGLSIGILTSASYTTVVVMAIVTTAAAAPLLRAAERARIGAARSARGQSS
jgi:Kef-type K+ transport system membrane component KefB